MSKELSLFRVIQPQTPIFPILISVPHAGTAFPEILIPTYEAKYVETPVDTDWFVDRLYSFAPHIGITLMIFNLSRYVIDLNRDPDSLPLYQDGRKESQLLPTHTFMGEPIYAQYQHPSESDIELRLSDFYWPYYHEVQNQLNLLKRKFGRALFFDAHSIRRSVPTIRKDPFPDLILGDRDGKSARPEVIELALRKLSEGPFEVSHNDPFKGGHLTRYFGRVHEGVDALQLEMAQDNYMDEDRRIYLPERAAKVEEMLKRLFLALGQELLADGGNR